MPISNKLYERFLFLEWAWAGRRTSTPSIKWTTSRHRHLIFDEIFHERIYRKAWSPLRSSLMVVGQADQIRSAQYPREMTKAARDKAGLIMDQGCTILTPRDRPGLIMDQWFRIFSTLEHPEMMPSTPDHRDQIRTELFRQGPTARTTPWGLGYRLRPNLQNKSLEKILRCTSLRGWFNFSFRLLKVRK